MAGKQSAIVTGASSGIGPELAKQCAGRGWDLPIAADELAAPHAGSAAPGTGEAA